MNKLNSHKGQGTLEYILIAAAVLFLVGALVKVIKGPAQARVAEIEQNMSNAK